MSITHLFVYGTLRPGDVRWHLLAPFVVDQGRPDTTAGRLFDTGLDYPAAMFGGHGTIHGESFALLESSIEQALALLDEVEDVVGGDYSRVAITTACGLTAWAYAYGAGLALTPIASGDWFQHRPPIPFA